MATVATETVNEAVTFSTTAVGDIAEKFSNLKFPAYAPTYDPTEKFPPYEEFDFHDPGLDADPDLKNLFPNGIPTATKDRLPLAEQLVKLGYSIDDLSPKFGSEVRGIQLSQLSKAEKDDLAKFVAERGVVIFRDQDFRELPVDQALEWASHFGRQHVHPTSGAPKGFPAVHLVFRDIVEGQFYKDYFSNKVSSIGWHSDVSYEKQPPGTTFLGILESPVTGGDTLFADTQEIYNRFSNEFKATLDGLKAVHSGFEQAEYSRNRGGVVRREPVKHEHPVVRTHPVTKKKSIYVNEGFTRNIVGFKKEESEYLLRFLYDTISRTADAQIRARWQDGTVVVWDNRRTVHSATLDFEEGERRHLFRYTPQADVPA